MWGVPTYESYVRQRIVVVQAYTVHYEFEIARGRVLQKLGVDVPEFMNYDMHRPTMPTSVVFPDNVVWDALHVDTDVATHQDPSDGYQGGDVVVDPDELSDPFDADSWSYFAEAPGATEISQERLEAEMRALEKVELQMQRDKVVAAKADAVAAAGFEDVDTSGSDEELPGGDLIGMAQLQMWMCRPNQRGGGVDKWGHRMRLFLNHGVRGSGGRFRSRRR